MRQRVLPLITVIIVVVAIVGGIANAADAQTAGVSFENDLFWTLSPGATSGVPFGNACFSSFVPNNTSVHFAVTANAPGLQVQLYATLVGTRCATVCLPPVGAPYTIPRNGCSGRTNQTLDLAPSFFLLTSGLTTASGNGGLFTSGAVILPRGITAAIQGVVFDVTNNVAVVTNAFTINT